jgi:ABC-type antimicrobial peptide transport system permease subunit
MGVGKGDTAGFMVLLSVAVFMSAVGVAAALGPARRALRIQPTEALRTD